MVKKRRNVYRPSIPNPKEDVKPSFTFTHAKIIDIGKKPNMIKDKEMD